MIEIIFTVISLFLLLCYCILIFVYRYWFTKLQPFLLQKNYEPVTNFSIIIPARNEEGNIEPCLMSILQNSYPKQLYEIIVIDDESDDNTVAIVHKIQQNYSNVRLMHIADLLKGKKINSHKKAAIEAAINISKGSMIITTDADCITPTNWLLYFDNYIQQTSKKFIAAPVAFFDNETFLGRFQCLDFLSLQGITAASVSAGFHSMCNGANLCYEKKLFFQVKGFAGIDHIASGDDMLLMHKIQLHDPESIGYLFSEESIVMTQPMRTLSGFINQRIRWASKATDYNDKKILLVLWLVYLLNVFLFIDFFIAFIHPVHIIYWLDAVVLKTVVELIFMQKVSRFFKQQNLLKYFPFMQPFHIAYTVLSGFMGKFGNYKWKGRNVQ
ncbi:MAG: glycosyltransferase [Arachidicoccus sp.]|nr:glycosyltransferase [Arachidicoccus sp.]